MLADDVREDSVSEFGKGAKFKFSEQMRTWSLYETNRFGLEGSGTELEIGSVMTPYISNYPFYYE